MKKQFLYKDIYWTQEERKSELTQMGIEPTTLSSVLLTQYCPQFTNGCFMGLLNASSHI